MTHQLFIYDTLSRRKVAFTPLDPSHVKVYACGPTVYSYAHIGNARMAVVFDQLARILRSIYPQVTYASNITDIDDKIIDASLAGGEDAVSLARRYEKIYNSDMETLGVIAPDIQPRASETVKEIIALIMTLIAKNHAYEAQGHVLFHVPSFQLYGKLSGRDRDEQIAGARVEVAPYKKDPADFVLWKPSDSSQPGWESPWGRGRPGWHIECSAMAQTHLGLPLDIHGAGADLKFPHNENETAQSVCACDKQDDLRAFARFWMHNGFLTVEGEKMSKSLGNVVLVHDLINQGIKGEAIRLTLLSAHYRQPLDWCAETLRASHAQLDRFYQTLHDVPPEDKDEMSAAGKIRAIQTTPSGEEFLAALLDDLNTPRAIAALNELSQKANSNTDPAMSSALKAAGNMLGVLLEDPGRWCGYGMADNQAEKERIDRLVKERDSARAQKNYSRADEIRAELASMDIIVEDSAQGPKWRKKTDHY